MKTVFTAALFTGFAIAHSGVWNVEVDGVRYVQAPERETEMFTNLSSYPARDTRMDGKLGAKRIEWSFKDAMVPWGPIQNVNDPGLTCGIDPKAPALKAVARAGANITVQWSGIVRTHYGPVMNYLAYLTEPNAKPQTLSFFKIAERGYDAQNKLWGNEALIKADRKDTFQIPSDIKPGMYVLRTELMSLHYASRSGPQFYSHCFNIDVKGTGTATPEGVKFPGGYIKTDPSLVTSLYKADGTENSWETYKIPGPAKYAGKYESPSGPAPVVSEKER
jgi:cellulase